jgi:hypothetical protein
MHWECTECGGYIRQERAPSRCRECGTAGVFFVPVDIKDPMTADPEADCLRAVWLRAGLHRGRAALQL